MDVEKLKLATINFDEAIKLLQETGCYITYYSYPIHTIVINYKELPHLQENFVIGKSNSPRMALLDAIIQIEDTLKHL